MGSPAERFDGAKSEDGLVWGTYLHGVFDAPSFRRDFLNKLRKRRGWRPLDCGKTVNEGELFASLAGLIRKHVDLAALHGILNGAL
jgi:adenosylcobyric acid synthase